MKADKYHPIDAQYFKTEKNEKIAHDLNQFLSWP